MKFTFNNIPDDSRFSVFDFDNKRTLKSWEIPIGNTEFDFEFPEECTSPHYVLRNLKYYIPRNSDSISGTSISFSGDDYYLDITRDKLEAELNQVSIEHLVTGIPFKDGLDFRQKFFICLVSLQSYYEYLTYGMLVLSSFKTNLQFENLNTSSNRINSAFSNANSFFFGDQISVCPGKTNLGSLITLENKNEIKDIFHMVRKMRNAVVHSWSYNELTKEELKTFFESVGEQVQMHLDMPEFYTHATQNFVRLYARTNYIRSQLLYFKEKEYIRLEREERGY